MKLSTFLKPVFLIIFAQALFINTSCNTDREDSFENLLLIFLYLESQKSSSDTVLISGVVLDENHEPVANPQLFDSAGSVAVTGDENGKILFTASTGGGGKNHREVSDANGTSLGSVSIKINSKKSAPEFSYSDGATFSITLLGMIPYSGEPDEEDDPAIMLGGDCTDDPSDPLFSDQWHLLNTEYEGEDVQVVPVWGEGYCGDEINIAIVDDGLDMEHPDLRDNITPGVSYNYTNGSIDTSGDGANHGTSVAGVIAGRANDQGVRGAAPLGNIRSYNYLQDPTDSNEADAMIRNIYGIHISNNSWGPLDATGNYFDSTSLWRDAVDEGLSYGRGGAGTIYVWAAGNGAVVYKNNSFYTADNSNYDGYANYYGVIAVCAVDNQGEKSYYSEKGANLWVCAPSSSYSNSPAITTTDNSGDDGFNIGYDFDYEDADYTNSFGGTSSAAPLAAGVIALVLEANPDLTWRDVKLILAESARRNDPNNTDIWTENGAGYLVSDSYGFGIVDATAAVDLAKKWINVGPMKTFDTGWITTNMSIPDDSDTGITLNTNISSGGISKIEYVEIQVKFNHDYPGDLKFVLTSPSATSSILSEAHSCYDGTVAVDCDETSEWRFGSARLLGEDADGTWTLSVKDLLAEDTGSLVSWRLKVYGRE